MITAAMLKQAAAKAYDELVKKGYTRQALRKAGITKTSLEVDIDIAACNRELMPMATILDDVVADVEREMAS